MVEREGSGVDQSWFHIGDRIFTAPAFPSPDLFLQIRERREKKGGSILLKNDLLNPWCFIGIEPLMIEWLWIERRSDLTISPVTVKQTLGIVHWEGGMFRSKYHPAIQFLICMVECMLYIGEILSASIIWSSIIHWFMYEEIRLWHYSHHHDTSNF